MSLEFLFKVKAHHAFNKLGPGLRSKGLRAHVRKELREIARNPYDPEEWADVLLLAADGMIRVYYNDLAANYGSPGDRRRWLDWAAKRASDALVRKLNVFMFERTYPYTDTDTDVPSEHVRGPKDVRTPKATAARKKSVRRPAGRARLKA